MECNKEEALRAKEIAEKKLMESDVHGAHKFAVKARSLYAGLDGLSQLVATLDVYVSAQKKINGEADWYGILGVDPSADDDAIRRSYRKLALLLHPDKNKAVGADGAFKILSEAWSLLSDRAKRYAYDLKRNSRVRNGKFPTPGHQNGFHSFPGTHQNDNAGDWRSASTSPYQNTNGGSWRGSAAYVVRNSSYPHRDCNTRDWKSAADANYASASPRTSFWTQCGGCRMKYEYLIRYLNQQILCPSPGCRKPFVANEIPPPPVDGHRSSDSQAFFEAQQYPCRMRNHGHASPAPNARSTSFSGIHLPPQFASSYGTLPKFASDNSAPAPASYAPQASGVFEPLFRHRKRGRGVAAAVQEEYGERIQMSKKARSDSVSMSADANSLETDRIEKRKVDEGGINKKVSEGAGQVAFANSRGVVTGTTPGLQKGSLDRGRVNFSLINRYNGLRDVSLLELRNMLIHKAKTDIRKKLDEWRVEKEPSNGRNSLQGEVKLKYGKVQKAPASGAKTAPVKHSEPVDGKDRVQMEKTSHSISNIKSEAENFVPMQMVVTDPDFYNFDKDRTEDSFADNQVWAAYDDDDGMPRYYALIHTVMSLKPFKMRISWLSSKTNQELGPTCWVGSGFAKTCGYLRIGKSVVDNSLNAFSHRMKWTKGARGLIHIYPLKGDVWALYRNWSSDWNELTPDEIIHSYDMVEVIEDYSDELGVTVAPLIKVCGFKTVFQKHPDPGKLWTVPREEMFRFSHQVPAHLLTGEEGANAPKGCWELDPASTPLELLQVVTTTGRGLEAKVDGTASVTVKGMKAKEEVMLVYKRKLKGKQS
ncbi:uncharacterized protein LOC115741554 [Rhodamnia argentea]|uniref:Uncharacterized protein LOC115741554 n=1 Tax=Rhodamnia argentea TaxID=178133 RepID=A0A8B8P968_9MYRT|nr:uncharacterized protein LOC115741554 [Rhodamnia argentea]XP_048135874.1 uncharacterized protein LOC115741554 [Rhodamnia argentea]